MFLSNNKKNNVYPCKPQFYMYYIKVGFKGDQNNIPRYVFVMCGEIVKHCNSLLYAVV